MHCAVVAIDVELKRARPLDEERPPLLKERLERVEVDDRRIGFDLAEVGIGGRGQREPRPQRVLQVEPDRAGRIGALDRAGCRSSACSDTLPSVYGSSSSFFGVPAHPQPAHLGELRDEPVGVARQQRPRRRLRQTADLADHGEADGTAIACC